MKSKIESIENKVAKNLKKRRLQLCLTQSEIADCLGISYQQVHKYEKGVDRISVGKLHYVARLFNRPITYFFGKFK